MTGDEGDKRNEDRSRVASDDHRDIATPAPRAGRRGWMIGIGSVVVIGGLGVGVWAVMRFPPDTEPSGAYLRIAYSVGRGDSKMVFPYLEDEAQHACFTIRDYRKKASDLVDKSYPEPERTRLMGDYRAHAEAPDGSDVWVDLAEKRGFVKRLRRDMSGIAKVDIEGERASVETARGTRYAFRRRPNGIWGLTLFTGDLSDEAMRAARDYDVVTRAARDYDRAGK